MRDRRCGISRGDWAARLVPREPRGSLVRAPWVAHLCAPGAASGAVASRVSEGQPAPGAQGLTGNPVCVHSSTFQSLQSKTKHATFL